MVFPGVRVEVDASPLVPERSSLTLIATFRPPPLKYEFAPHVAGLVGYDCDREIPSPAQAAWPPREPGSEVIFPSLSRNRASQ
jgi:hypothetical protein